MKKIITGVCLLLACLAIQAQSGLQGIIVEKYYVSNANDSIVSAAQGGGNLRVGSVTWRFYADLLPNYKLQAVYGVDVAPTGTVSSGDHELRLETSTKFFNNEDRGAVTPTFSKANTASNSVLLDSWFSMGNGCAGYYGVLKSVDNGVSTTANANGMLLNNDPLAGNLTSQDGLLTGSGAAQAVTLVPSTLGSTIFNATSQAGSLFSTYNGSWASLNGSSGPDTSNKVLIAQLTTNGTLTYAFNLQIGTPSGGVQRFVAANPVGSETYNSTLSGTLYPFAGCSCSTPTVPTTPALITSTGAASVCPGDVRKYTVTKVGCTLHFWTAPAGASVTAGQNTDTVTITYGAGFTANGTLSVVAKNACGTSSAAKTLAITRNVPASPGVITGVNTPVCSGSSHNYSVVNVNGITYNWTGTAGISVTAGQTTNAITAAFSSFSTGTLSVTAANTCATSAASTLALTSIPAATSNIFYSGGAAKVCPGDSRTYYVTNVSGVTYTWVVPTGATINSGQGTSSISVTYGAGFIANGTITVTPSNACGSGTTKTLAIARNVPATPSAITGPGTIVCSGSNQNYSVTNVSGITYNWTGTSGISVVSGQTTNAITAAFSGFTTGSISVTAGNTCATSAAKTLAISSVPLLPSNILVSGGAAKVCPGDTRTYSVTNVSGVTYTWAVPTGATINSGQGTNSISVTYDAGFTAAGTISVSPANSCGTGTSKTLAIALNVLAAPATLTGQNYDLCGASGVVYTAAQVVGASSYSWSLTGGASGGAFNPASSTYTSTVDFPSSTFTGAVKIGANNGCGTGALKSLNIYAAPAIPVITGNATVCNNALETYSATAGASSYVWTIPAGATFVGSSTGSTVQVQFGTIPVNPKIIVKNYNGCTYNTKTLILVWGSCKTDEALNSGVGEVENAMGISDLNVFPNPSSSVFNISFNNNTDGEQMNIRVFDVAGKLVKETSELSHSGATNVAVDLSAEASGVYVVSLQTQGVTKRIRLLKQ